MINLIVLIKHYVYSLLGSKSDPFTILFRPIDVCHCVMSHKRRVIENTVKNIFLICNWLTYLFLLYVFDMEFTGELSYFSIISCFSQLTIAKFNISIGTIRMVSMNRSRIFLMLFQNKSIGTIYIHK